VSDDEHDLRQLRAPGVEDVPDRDGDDFWVHADDGDGDNKWALGEGDCGWIWASVEDGVGVRDDCGFSP
jgi:hypothetical protein